VQTALIEAMDSRRARIRARWETLMKGERVSTPLARPEFLVYLIDATLDRVFAALRERASGTADAGFAGPELKRAYCECGRNPLLLFFLAGEQTLLEELIHLQAATPEFTSASRELEVTELYLAVRREARREVGAFCSVCVHSGGGAPRSKHSVAVDIP
jgi:hypothetical protein